MTLAPQPGRTVSFPRPIKIISKSSLRRVWNQSRDATPNPGRPGTDNSTAQQFASKLDLHLSEITRRVKKGELGFSKLRAVFIPKAGSDKERMICIPTVQDRLVQRVILEYVVSKKLFPIENSSSFGFIKGKGTREAIQRAVELREKYAWCLKTDIESFFDKIPRPYLRSRVRTYLGHHSLVPVFSKIIGLEVAVTPNNQDKISDRGIKTGLGIRQGMPLSPLLANLILVEFDREIKRQKIEMVRYADDLVLFFNSKEEAEVGQKLVKSLLEKIDLSIPEISQNSKTQILSGESPLDFLGREIKYLGAEGRFVSCVSNKQIDKIKTRLAADFSIESRLKEKKNFQETIVDLSKSIAAYSGIYGDVYNYKQFDGDLRGQGRSIIMKIFRDLFGRQALASLSDDGRIFLGIGTLDAIEPNAELDV